jgi:phosphoribosylaminoimidazole-succinocarboxamide synthase
MMAYALRVNDYLSGLFAAAGIRLVDFKLEFGRQYENEMVRLILADEISPDSCRLWDLRSGEIMDKDRFRKDLGDVVEGYREVARRLGVLRGDDSPSGEPGPKLVSDNGKTPS